MKSLICLLITITIAPSVFSQGLYENGYFVTNAGKRIDALIDIFNLDKKRDRIFYTEKHNSEIKSISTSDILELRVSNYKFATLETTLDVNRGVTEVIEPEFGNKRVFLRIEVEGYVSFYSTFLGEQEIFFFSIDNQKPQELIYKNFIRYDGEESWNPIFRKQLSEQIKCHKLNNEVLKNTNYIKNDLKKIVIEANDCLDKSYFVLKGAKKSALKYLNLSISLGGSFIGVSSTSIIQENKIVDFNEFSIPSLGIEAEFLFPFTNNRVSSWIRGDYLATQTKEIGSFLDVDQEAVLTYQLINATLGLRYYAKISKSSKLFFDVGYGKAFEVDQGFSIDYQLKEDYNNPTITGSLTGGVGFVFRNRYVIDSRLIYLNSNLKSPENSFENVSHTSVLFSFKYLVKSYYK